MADGALLDSLATSAAAHERDRALSPAAVALMQDAGVFASLVPEHLGGREVPPGELVGLIEAIASADGAAGWCAGVGATAGLAAAYLPEPAARGLFGDPPAIAAGVFAPKGRLEPSGEDAYGLSGRWQLASGISHAEVVGLGCIDPGRGPLYAVIPRGQVEVFETWDSLGLRATASHDVEADRIVVPAEHVVDLAGGHPVATGPLYSFPLFGLLALSVSAVCTGLALGALADLREVATARRPAGSSRPLAERGTTQDSFAAAEGSLRAARAGVDRAVEIAWEAARSVGSLGIGERAGLRLAATHAAQTSVAVVDLAHRLSGAGGLYRGTAERRFRDVHTAAQHMIVSPATLELSGRVLLGLETDTAQL